MLYIVSWNQAHGEVYSIQHYVIKFVSDLWQVDGFLWVSSTNKTGCHDITEILSKVALNTIILNPQYVIKYQNSILNLIVCYKMHLL
jgi:hypothetical protein